LFRIRPCFSAFQESIFCVQLSQKPFFGTHFPPRSKLCTSDSRSSFRGALNPFFGSSQFFFPFSVVGALLVLAPLGIFRLGDEGQLPFAAQSLFFFSTFFGLLVEFACVFRSPDKAGPYYGFGTFFFFSPPPQMFFFQSGSSCLVSVFLPILFVPFFQSTLSDRFGPFFFVHPYPDLTPNPTQGRLASLCLPRSTPFLPFVAFFLKSLPSPIRR